MGIKKQCKRSKYTFYLNPFVKPEDPSNQQTRPATQNWGTKPPKFNMLNK